jgi:flagellin
LGHLPGQIHKSDLNTALSAAGVNLTASISGADKLTFTSTNDGAGQVITKTGGAPTALDAIDVTGTGGSAANIVAAVADPVSQATRANLVSQYNQILTQITTTAQDSSFDGVNLLNGDSLKLVFDETGKSSVTITGVTFNPTGLGLSNLTAGTDFTVTPRPTTF